MEFQPSILLIVFLLGTISCQLEDMFRTSSKKYCGSHLVQALQAICKGNYNTIHKQDIYQKTSSYWDSDYISDMPDGKVYPFKTRSEATAILGKYKRRKRHGPGVYNECCEKSCTREELSSYCGSPYRRKR